MHIRFHRVFIGFLFFHSLLQRLLPNRCSSRLGVNEGFELVSELDHRRVRERKELCDDEAADATLTVCETKAIGEASPGHRASLAPRNGLWGRKLILQFKTRTDK